MKGQEGADRIARAGGDVLRRRLAAVLARAAGVLGAVIALGACAIAALFGSGPGAMGLIAIVLLTGLVFYLATRALVMRIDPAMIVSGLARRAGRRR